MIETRFFDRINNLDIARAAAEISGDAPPDFILRRIGVFIQKGLGGHEHPRGGKPHWKPPHLMKASCKG